MTDVEPPRRSRRTAARSHYRDPLGALTVAGIAYFIALLLAVFIVPAVTRLGVDGAIAQLLAFLLIWAPLVAGVIVAGDRSGSRSLRADAGLSIRPIDIGLGLLVGLVLRFGVEAILPAVSPDGTLDGAVGAPPTAQLIVLIIGSVLIAPLVEETFFRGLLQRSVSGLVRGGRAVRIIVAVVVSTPLFVLLHAASAPITSWGVIAVTVGISGLVFGLLAASMRRLGAAIVAHAVFNAVGLVILYVR